jgi:hypothetical protein
MEIWGLGSKEYSTENYTTTFMSKIISSPDLDKINMEKDPEDKKTIQQ